MAGRLSSPTAISRTWPSPTIEARFTALGSASIRLKYFANDVVPSLVGTRDPPSWPVTMVVTP